MSQQQQSRQATVPVRVWDLPTRAFHWALVLGVSGAVVSAKIGGELIVWHMRCGYAVLALLAFRLAWGLLGGRWSRLRELFHSPAAIWRYLRRRPAPGERFDVGHNPLGGLSVLLMLGWLLLQAGSGLIADDEIATTGPLARFVSSETSLAWTAHHKRLGQWGLIALASLHVLAVAAHGVLGERGLVRAMFSGDKQLPAHTPASVDTAGTRLLALIVLLACVGAVLWLVGLDAP